MTQFKSGVRRPFTLLEIVLNLLLRTTSPRCKVADPDPPPGLNVIVDRDQNVISLYIHQSWLMLGNNKHKIKQITFPKDVALFLSLVRSWKKKVLKKKKKKHLGLN